MKYGGSTSSNLQLNDAKEFEFLSSVVSEEIERYCQFGLPYWRLPLKKVVTVDHPNSGHVLVLTKIPLYCMEGLK